jgi:hypothetical protein
VVGCCEFGNEPFGEFRRMRGMSWLAKELLTSQE